MKRLLPILLLAIAARAEESSLRWALSEGEHRLQSSVFQRISVSPPGQAPLTVRFETEETWKADVRLAGGSWRVSLTWERLRAREEDGVWREVDPAGPDEGWGVARLRALRGLAFDLVLAPDGRVRSCDARRLDLPPPPGLPQDIHDAMWDPTGLAKSIRAMWIRLPPTTPAPGEMVHVEDADIGVRRLRTWQRRPEKDDDLTDPVREVLARLRRWARADDELMFTAVFPDGAPQPPRDTLATISPDVVSVTWDAANEYGVAEADLAAGVVKGVGVWFHTELLVQVRAGEVLETWQGDCTIEQVFRIDPPE